MLFFFFEEHLSNFKKSFHFYFNLNADRIFLLFCNLLLAMCRYTFFSIWNHSRLEYYFGVRAHISTNKFGILPPFDASASGKVFWDLLLVICPCRTADIEYVHWRYLTPCIVPAWAVTDRECQKQNFVLFSFVNISMSSENTVLINTTDYPYNIFS